MIATLPLLLAAQTSIAVAGGTSTVTIHGFELGRIAVKRAHAELRVPAATPTPLRFAHIFCCGGAFQQDMPILAFAIVHPEGTFLVDTGESATAAVDSADANLLRMKLPPQQSLVTQLSAAGIANDSIRGVVLTHLHVDHVGGLASLPRVPVYTSRIDVELGSRIGARSNRIPADAPMRFSEDLLVDHGDEVDAVFGRSHFLTTDGRVRVVPATGHTPGSLNVLVRGDDVDVLLTGDDAFTAQHVCEGHLAGIHVDLNDAAETMARVRRWATRRPTLLMPSHDDNALVRLRDGTVTTAQEKNTTVKQALGTNDHFMWVNETSASPASVWRMWTDVSTWPRWDTELASASLEGGFARGNTGNLKTTDGTTASFEVVAVEPGVRAVFATSLPLGKMIITRSLVALPNGGTRFTHDVAFVGASSPLFSRLLGARYRTALPMVMGQLAHVAGGG
jgi:N-acyl homoserine lactone hydrolase